MNSENNLPAINQLPEEPEVDNTLSIEEFFRQLEAKEKDLDISSDLIIEVDEFDMGEQDPSDFMQIDLSVAPNKLTIFDKPLLEEIPLPAPSAPPADSASFQLEIENLQNQITRMETERVELFEMSRRRQNDFENYKSRTERERGETFRNQLCNLAMQLLPVIDNLNRALDSTSVIANEKRKDFQQFYEGIVLVSQQMNEILLEMGVQPILAVGEPFDPYFHEAVATEITDEFPSQTVTTELLRGYHIGEKVVRASMVKVSVSTTSGNLPQIESLAVEESGDAEQSEIK